MSMGAELCEGHTRHKMPGDSTSLLGFVLGSRYSQCGRQEAPGITQIRIDERRLSKAFERPINSIQVQLGGTVPKVPVRHHWIARAPSHCLEHGGFCFLGSSEMEFY